MIRSTESMNSDTEQSSISGALDGLSDRFSESTLSRSNSLERLKATEGYVEETLRVDRKNLESMILGCPSDPWDKEIMKLPIDKNGKVKSAADFFDEIMALTNTIIKYPKYLKVGAKNVKDPHVKVIGLPEAVSEASQMIQYELHPRNKITMKMDVPWTCHSHIIGKGGNTIQPVVRRTGVTIHFPDGNKNSETSKSNQVSINSRGQEITGLEEARRAIRDLTLLIFTFSFPATVELISFIESSCLVSHIQLVYNVQADIQLFNEQTLLGTVKGTEWDATRVKEATLCLLRGLCGNMADQIPVQVLLDISPQHHSFVLGRNNKVVKSIMQQTATEIVFPDWNDPLLPPLKRSAVKINGAIENVYHALQNLIGCLPLVLMFDLLPEHTIDQSELKQIMQTLDIIIIIKKKRMDGKRCAIIKGAERNATNIYEAWRMVTKRLEAVPRAKIPPTYVLTDPPSFCSIANNEPIQDNFLGYTSLEDETLPPCSCNTEFKEERPLHSLNTLKSNYSVVHMNTSEKGKTLLELSPDRRAPGCEKKQGVVSDYLTKKLLAAKVMEQPVFPEPRMPTSSWSGYGFSKSQPASFLNYLKNKSEGNYASGWLAWSKDSSGNSTVSEESCHMVQNVKHMVNENNFIDKSNTYAKSASNYLDSLLPSLDSQWDKNSFNDVTSILLNLQLEQYKEHFNSRDIDVNEFCNLNDQDLKDLGVTTFGHRKKLLMAIKKLSLERKSYLGN